MKRVLVTGGTGFVGSHCIEPLFARGFEVHLVTRNPGHSTAAIHHQGDLLDSQQLASLLDRVQPSHLLHLAWFVTPGVYWASARNWDWVGASLDLVKRFAANGGQRAVLVGTGAEYDARFARCVEGKTPVGPVTMYGACKASLGLLLPVFAAAHGLESTAWARLFYLYGPREHPDRLVPSAVRALLCGRTMACTSGEQVRDPLFVADAAEALVSVLDSSVTGPVNIGSGHGVPVHSLLSCIGHLLGRESLLEFGALATRPGEAATQVADVTRLAHEVGWRPRLTLHEGLAQTITWWRKELDLHA